MRIYDYFDYRLYLHDYYNFQKDNNPHFSYRYFMYKAGYKSPGLYLSLVQRKANLSMKMIPKFAKGLGLNEKETEYLKLMVQFDSEQDSEKKQRIFDSMVLFLPQKSKRATEKEIEYFNNPIYAVLREALQILPIRDEYSLLADFLFPKVSPEEIRAAVAVMEQLNLIKKNEDGVWVPCEKTIVAGEEVGVDVIHEYQLKWIDKSKLALSKVAKEKRDFTTRTLCLSRENFDKIRKKLEHLQKEISEMMITQQEVNQVYQFNIQLFPVTKSNRF